MNASKTVSYVLAVLGPLAVFYGTWVGLRDYVDEEDAMGMRNAGYVFNAIVRNEPTDVFMDKVLLKRNPEVIVLGPSHANTDVNTAVLAMSLGVSKEKTMMLSVPNSVGSHWYSMLKYRVFDKGYQPKLIVIVSGLQSMLLNTPLTESSWINLNVQVPDGGDPLVNSLTDQPSAVFVARLREQRSKIRGTFLGMLRERIPRVLRGMKPQQVRSSLARVFDGRKVDMGLYGRVAPVVEERSEAERAYTPEMLPAPQVGFIPEITRLVHSHGANIVWVRPPMSPLIPPHLADEVLPGVQEQMAKVVRENGGVYLDMRDLPMSSAMYRDEDHMNDEGSKRFTRSLAAALMEIDALGPPGGRSPISPKLFVNGKPVSTVTSLEPGETLLVRLEEGWDATRGPLSLHIATRGRAVVEIEGREVDIHSLGDNYYIGSKAAHAEGPVEATIGVAEGLDGVFIDAVAFGEGPVRIFGIGDEAGLNGRKADLFPRPDLIDGAIVDRTIDPVFRTPPPLVPGHDREFLDANGRMASFETERWGFLSDEAVAGVTSFGTRCSPLRVRENGVTLTGANVPCIEAFQYGRGRSCHTLERILFTASDNTDPMTNRRKYTMALAEERRCDGDVWVYPKDSFDTAWPKERLALLQEAPVRYFSLAANYLNQRKAGIRVILKEGNRVRIDSVVDGREFKEHAMVWRLNPPISQDSTVSLSVENLEHTFYLLTDAVLSDRPTGLGPVQADAFMKLPPDPAPK